MKNLNEKYFRLFKFVLDRFAGFRNLKLRFFIMNILIKIAKVDINSHTAIFRL